MKTLLVSTASVALAGLGYQLMSVAVSATHATSMVLAMYAHG